MALLRRGNSTLYAVLLGLLVLAIGSTMAQSSPSKDLFDGPSATGWDHENYHYFSIILSDQSVTATDEVSLSFQEKAFEICQQLNVHCIRQVGELQDVWLVATQKSSLEKRDGLNRYRRSLQDDAIDTETKEKLDFHPVHKQLVSHDDVLDVEKQVPLNRLFKRDPNNVPLPSNTTNATAETTPTNSSTTVALNSTMPVANSNSSVTPLPAETTPTNSSTSVAFNSTMPVANSNSSVTALPAKSNTTTVTNISLPTEPQTRPPLPEIVVQTEWFEKLNRTRNMTGIKANLSIDDPSFSKQWHLYNTEQPGMDLNVPASWGMSVGWGITVAVIDDGIDHQNPDLAPNFSEIGSYDFNDQKKLPTPALWDDTHGTRCAGEIAAAKNDFCGVGIAPGAKIAGIRILSGTVSNADEAAAVNYGFQSTQVYSCSWGPRDDGRTMDKPPPIVEKAFENGVKHGRGGRGSIFVFAAGNGGYSGDNCNYDGYTNSIYTVTVSAFTRNLEHPSYAEQCPAILISMLSGHNHANGIWTTDWKDGCTNHHAGTSAAAPLAAGLYALVLSKRPDLCWRAIQRLSVENAIPLNLEQGEYKLTYAKRHYSHKFGYGTLDAQKLVRAAVSFKQLNPQTKYETPLITLNKDISPNPGSNVTSIAVVTRGMLDNVRLWRLEHVVVMVSIECERRGDIRIVLTSPHGIVSRLIEGRPYDDKEQMYEWSMSTNAHWDEDPEGNWTIAVIDAENANYKSKFMSWKLTLYGESWRATSSNQTVSANASKISTAPSNQTMSTNTTKLSNLTTVVPSVVQSALPSPSLVVMSAKTTPSPTLKTAHVSNNNSKFEMSNSTYNPLPLNPSGPEPVPDDDTLSPFWIVCVLALLLAVLPFLCRRRLRSTIRIMSRKSVTTQGIKPTASEEDLESAGMLSINGSLTDFLGVGDRKGSTKTKKGPDSSVLFSAVDTEVDDDL